MSLHVALVVPDRELWSGEADTVIAKTTEGDIGILIGHSPVFGILAEGSLVEIIATTSPRCARRSAAGSCRWPMTGSPSWPPRLSSAPRSTPSRRKRELDAALAEVGSGAEEPADAKYARALLRAADQA